MGRYCFALAVALLLVCAGNSSAGMKVEAAGDIPRLFGIFSPEPGVWSEYAVFDKHTGTRTVMRMSIVGQEGDAYWYEVVNQEPAGRNVVKMLVDGDPEDPENIRRLILKSGDQSAREMPRDFVMMGRRMAGHMFEQRSGVPVRPGMVLRNEELGAGKATVPAGTFEVTRNRIVDQAGRVFGRYQFSGKVKPFGVISSDTEASSMVLLDYGTGARSVIEEEPRMMTRPPGMPEGLPRGLPPGMPVPGMPEGRSQ